ncbi:MAG TPA: flavin reductase family protein [Chloroflexota bacterium]|nr:flavin reductase family protein [Chloroflexota bacterium]
MSEIFGRAGGPREGTAPAGEMPERASPNAESGRWLRRHHAGGVYALTTVADGGYRAATLTGVLMASLEPLLFLVSLDRDSQIEAWVRAAGYFGLSLLTVRQQFLADQFAGFAPLAPKTFQGIDHVTAVTGAPLLTAAIGWADCRVEGEIETGDHTAFLARAVEVGRGAGADDEPLIYYRSRYPRLR